MLTLIRLAKALVWCRMLGQNTTNSPLYCFRVVGRLNSLRHKGSGMKILANPRIWRSSALTFSDFFIAFGCLFWNYRIPYYTRLYPFFRPRTSYNMKGFYLVPISTLNRLRPCYIARMMLNSHALSYFPVVQRSWPHLLQSLAAAGGSSGYTTDGGN